ncbi:hypothetical protein EX30DRAFT_362974 [Ascodesmis nigricans]|uniref:separase n=1 Tax=Ascodesmis nigricans TaxID=341454 RepID=A0A4S2N066_9PEZI|nr:hypothetical protein EX30DRAFT_362974 [Ascodesmis nigricans]
MPPKAPARALPRTTTKSAAPRTPAPSDLDAIKASIVQNTCSATTYTLLSSILSGRTTTTTKTTTARKPAATSGNPYTKSEQRKLASDVVTLSLRSLGDTVKAISKNSTNSFTSGSSSTPEPTIPSARAGNIKDRPTMDETDYIAYCCSAAISHLQGLEENEGSAGYELIKARWMLASRMVEVRKFKLALKEFKTMKRKLETILVDGKSHVLQEITEPQKTTTKSSKTAGKRNAASTEASEKEPFSKVLELPPIPKGHEALPYAIKCQLGILHCVLGLKRPDLVEAVIPFAPNASPLALIRSLPEDSGGPIVHVMRLTNLLQNLAPPASPSKDAIAMDPKTYCSPMVAFMLHAYLVECIAFQSSAQQNTTVKAKDLWAQFAMYISALIRRTKNFEVPKRVERHALVCETAENIRRVLHPHMDGVAEYPLEVLKALSTSASQTTQLKEPLKWTKRWQRAISSGLEVSDEASTTLCNVRLAFMELKLASPQDPSTIISSDMSIDTLERQITLAFNSLSEMKNGTKAGFEAILQECGQFRRSAYNLLASVLTQPKNRLSSDAILLKTRAEKACEIALRSIIGFCRKYLATVPTADELSRNLQIIVSAVDAVVSTCWRVFDFTDPSAWDNMEDTLNDCRRVVRQVEKDGEESPFLSFHVKISMAYWQLYLVFRNISGCERESERSLRRSVLTMEGRPTTELTTASISSRWERLGTIYLNARDFTKAEQALTTALDMAVKTQIVKQLTEQVLSGEPPQRIFNGNERDILTVGRILSGLLRIASKRKDESVDNLRFEYEVLNTSARGLLLEWSFFLALDNPEANGNIIMGVGERLLDVYDLEEMPLRRARIIAGLLGVAVDNPALLNGEELQLLGEEVYEWEMNDPQFDADEHLKPYMFDILASCYIGMAFSEWEHRRRPELVKLAMGYWMDTLHTVKDWEGVLGRIEDPDSLMRQLQMLVDFFDMKGDMETKLAAMKILVKLRELQAPADDDALAKLYTTLGLHYHRLGYCKKAEHSLHQARDIIKSDKPISTEARLHWHLAYTEFLVTTGEADAGEECFKKASDLAARHPEFFTGPDVINSKRRYIRANQLIASAAYVTSMLAFEKGNPTEVLLHARRSLRLYHRLWASLAKRELPPTTSTDAVAAGMGALSLSTSKPNPVDPQYLQQSGLWYLVPNLHRCFLQTVTAYRHLGMVREALNYAEESMKVARAVASPHLIATTLIVLGDLQIRSGQLAEGEKNLNEAMEMRIDGRNRVALELALGNLMKQRGEREKEVEAYRRALEVLTGVVDEMKKDTGNEKAEELAEHMSSMKIEEPVRAKTPTGRRSPALKKMPTGRKTPVKRGETRSLKSKASTLEQVIDGQDASEYKMLLLQQGHIHRLIGYSLAIQNQWAAAMESLKEAAKLPLDQQEAIFQGVAEARTLLQEAMDTLSESPVFNVLLESTISLPNIDMRGEIHPVEPVKKASRKAVAADNVETFKNALERARACVHTVHSRAVKWGSSAAVQQTTSLMAGVIVLLSAIADSKGKGVEHPLFANYSLELRNGIATRREQLTVQTERLTAEAKEALEWPVIETAHTARLASRLAPFEFSTFLDEYINIIPKSWIVVSISLSDTQKELYISRYQAGRSQFLVRLPLSREHTAEEDEEEMTYAEGREELEDIIKAVNNSTHNARHQITKEDRIAWWQGRDTLDERLKNLLEAMEDKWLGGFRGIFGQPTRNPELLARFKASFDKILAKGLPSRRKKKNEGRVEIDRRVLELFIALGSPDDNELDLPLKDLFNFVIDILQFHGEGVGYDEVDYDIMVVEMLDTLRAYHAEAARLSDPSFNHNGTGESSSVDHTILILDKHTQMFPWESLPCLQSRPVSRVPSLAVLHDLILSSTTPIQSRPGHYITPTSGGYVLNPDSDLSNTQKVFEQPLLRLTHTVDPLSPATPTKWKPIINRAPTEPEFLSILSSTPLLLYFGHGSGSHYINPRTIRKMDSPCAVACLMGCSSGKLADLGEFEPYGPVSNYILAGSPCVLAMLWDVTDRDTDKFSLEVLRDWGLLERGEGEEAEKEEKVGLSRKPSGKGRGRAGRKKIVIVDAEEEDDGGEERVKPKGVSLVEAVAKARSVCKSRYLNGAAPVVYGIPTYVKA